MVISLARESCKISYNSTPPPPPLPPPITAKLRRAGREGERLEKNNGKRKGKVKGDVCYKIKKRVASNRSTGTCAQR